MRIYEFAKKVQTSSMEVLKQAKLLDIDAESPLTSLVSADEKRLRELFAKRPVADIEQAVNKRQAKLSEKRKKGEARNADVSKAERATLESNRKRSIEMDARKKGKVAEPPKAVDTPLPPLKPSQIG